MKKSEATIGGLIEPTVNALGLELWGIEHVSQGKFSTLRIYIESDAGITVDDCEKVSRQVSAILDVEDPISGEYTLEVSSPGLDRPLFSLEQFESFAGSEVSVRLRSPLDGRRKFKGIITEVSEGTVCIEVDGETFSLPHAEVEKANIVYR
ncbi:MAG: ribosome maturation factor RimP [Gammaproteobacteria bacterium]